jgi:acetyl-CoA/propionyl-CoA carboxylase biotin carboxyl carrier protein
MDSGVEAGFTIPQEYDSLVSKLIAWAPDREAARRRALRALAEYRIEGPATTIPFARAILENEAFRTGDVGTAFIGAHLDELISSIPPEGGRITNRPAATMERGEDRAFEVEVNRKLFQVRLTELSAQKRKQLRTRPKTERASTLEADAVHSPMHGTVIGIGKQIGESVEPGETLFVIEAMKMENEISAQRGGTVRSIDVEIGQAVETDQRLATIE